MQTASKPSLQAEAIGPPVTFAEMHVHHGVGLITQLSCKRKDFDELAERESDPDRPHVWLADKALHYGDSAT